MRSLAWTINNAPVEAAKRQDVKVRPGDALALGPVVGDEGAHQQRSANGERAHDREAVEDDRVGDGRRGAVVGDVGPLEDGDRP